MSFLIQIKIYKSPEYITPILEIPFNDEFSARKELANMKNGSSELFDIEPRYECVYQIVNLQESRIIESDWLKTHSYFKTIRNRII